VLALIAAMAPRAILAQSGKARVPPPAVVTESVQRVPLNQSGAFTGHVQAIQSAMCMHR